MSARWCIFCGRPETPRWELETATDSIGTAYAHCVDPADCWRYGVRQFRLRVLSIAIILAGIIAGGVVLLLS